MDGFYYYSNSGRRKGNMRNRKWLHVSMVLVLLLSFLSPLTISKTHAETGLSQVSLTESETGITLSWEVSLPENEEITSYQLNKNGQTIEIEPTVQSEIENVKQYSYEDTEIEPNTRYTYEITAVTSSGNLLTSEKVEYQSVEITGVGQGDRSTVPERDNGPVPPSQEQAAELAKAKELGKTKVSPVPYEETSQEVIVTNIKVSTVNGNIPWDFDYLVVGVDENVADVAHYGWLDEEGYFIDYDYETKNLELPTGTYELITYNYSTDEEIRAEFKVESERDYLTHPIEIILDDDQLIIKKELYVEGVSEQSISIYWDEPWEPKDIKNYQVYLNNTLVKEIKDPYTTTYTFNDLLPETTYQLKVDISYKDGTVETIEAEAKTTAPPAGGIVQFKDENLKMAVAEALKVFHRDDIYVDDMERLTSLEASYREIQDLTGLEHATNLVDLTINENEIKDLTPIKDLTNLTFIDLDYNQISDIKKLANLKSLETVFLAYNELEEIDTLLELPNLAYVSLYGNEGLDFTKGSDDMEVIQKLQEKEVYVEWTNAEHEIFLTNVTESTVEFEINFFNIVENITKYIIYVNGEEVGETPASKPFYKLTGLEPLSELDITVEGVDEEGFVWGSAYEYVKTPPAPSGKIIHFADPALEEAIKSALYITSRDVRESDLSVLTSLDASYLGITDLTGLEYATNLEELYLDSNSITNLKPLSDLTNLIFLSLTDNEISDISILKDLKNLDYLGLDGNEIKDIGVIAGFTNLTVLSVERNMIQDISALKNLNLEFLFLSNNEISDLSSLLTLENLMLVFLTENPLDLTEGSEALAIIRELEDKGVYVVYEYLDISVENVTESEIELSWTPITSDGFEDFIYSIDVDGEEVAIDITDTTYVLTDLEPETEYMVDIYGYVENDEERFIMGTTVVTTAAYEEPGDETDPEEGGTPEEQPADDSDEVTAPGKNTEKDTEKGSTPKETNDKKEDKKTDDKKLPKTATNSYNALLIGLLLLGAGIITFVATRKKTA